MKIALIGYGKMGKTIESIAIARGHSIISRLHSKSGETDWNGISNADVAIEFSRPEVALENFNKCLALNVPVVTGTTGWYNEMTKVKKLVLDANGAFFWASNFSVGVNLFWHINKKLAELMNGHRDYKPSMIEIHHTQKLDEPSGTAITTAEQIIDANTQYTEWTLDEGNTFASDIYIKAIREGDVKGTHVVKYESDIDSIELKHEAKSRDGFALGALLAAEFLNGKKGYYTMEDMLRT